MNTDLIRKAVQIKLAAMRKEALLGLGSGSKAVDSVKAFLAVSAGIVAFEELLKGIKGGVKSVSHGAQENPRWKRLLQKFPEFGEGDQAETNREIFETIHDLSPTVSKNPTMAAQMLHAAREYGLPGLDINTAKTLADLEKSKTQTWKTQTEIGTSPATPAMSKSLPNLFA